MTNKNKAQGTAHESHLRRRAVEIGRTARRRALAGQKHEPDVEVDGDDMLPVLAWKAYHPKNGQKKRRATRMIVMREQDFWDLYSLDTAERYGLLIQAKACERIGVRATLLGLVDWCRANLS